MFGFFMVWICNEFSCGTILDDTAVRHDRHSVSHARYQRKIMRDQQVAQSMRCLQI